MAEPAGLTLAEARAVALRAQQFGVNDGCQSIDLLDRLGAIQLDSVNVVGRTHDLTPAARLGPCSIPAMHQAVYDQRGGFEYWGHAACWLPMADYRYFLPRMADRREHGRNWFAEWDEVRGTRADLFAAVLDRIKAEGPLSTAAFDGPRPASVNWGWNWKPAKLVLEDLFDRGDLMVSGRTNGFARLYDLPERVVPTGLDVSDPGWPAAARYLLLRAASALGIGTTGDLADYFRLHHTRWRPALAELVEDGQLVKVAVEGWRQPAYARPDLIEGPLDPPAHRPTFLTPFDNLIWERSRTERLFGFTYRIEIYTPGPQRTYGYYVLPLLARGQLLGRADLKLDRKSKRLRCIALYLEGAEPAEAVAALGALARHLGVQSITVEGVTPAKAAPTVARLLRTVH